MVNHRVVNNALKHNDRTRHSGIRRGIDMERERARREREREIACETKSGRTDG